MDQTTSPRNGNTLKGRLLRRRVVLRERDYLKLHRDALACGYHRTSWEPLTYENIRREMTWEVLRGGDFKDTVFFSQREIKMQNTLSDLERSMMKVLDNEEKFMRQYIFWTQGNQRLYNKKWSNWSWKVENGTVKIRWARNREYEPLGVATLERDY